MFLEMEQGKKWPGCGTDADSHLGAVRVSLTRVEEVKMVIGVTFG